MSASTLLLWAWPIASVAFGLLFFAARRLRNFGVVDIAWAGGFLPLAAFCALRGEGAVIHRVLIGVMMGAWSLRLALMLGDRVWRLHPEEDGRYVQLRKEWADRLDATMAGFYLLQAQLLVLLGLPAALAAGNAAPNISAWEWAGAALWLVALAGETLADAQLAAFKRDPANRGKVCDRGLWRYSRHPNYFFEWLVWIGFALVATPAPHGWMAWACPLLMVFFLLRVTGIRYTEEQLLRSKGAAYRAYQERTSAFIPWPPRGA